MIETLLGIESALLIAMSRCRKRAAVLRSLAAKRSLDRPGNPVPRTKYCSTSPEAQQPWNVGWR